MQYWRYCQVLINTYARNDITAAPVAKPSSPSVRLTPFVVAVMRNHTHTMNKASGRTKEVSEMNETAREAGVRPSALGN